MRLEFIFGGEAGMATAVKTKFSKELQVKLRREIGTSDDNCIATLEAVLRSIQASGRFDFHIEKLGMKSWRRHG
jgi:hypothetical protein